MAYLKHYLILLVWICIACPSYTADTDYLRTTLQQKFGKNRHHLVNLQYKKAARDFIFQEFQKFGLEASYQNFAGSPLNVDLNGRTFTNVIGIWKGANFGTAQDRIVGIGAHYDTVKATSGVDDNGAGVVAMLDTAWMLTSHYRNPKNTVIFVAFDIEEYLFYVDGIGSQHFVDNWLFPWLQKNYGNSASKIQPYGIIVLDTVMYFDTTADSQKIPGDGALFQLAFPDTYKNIKSDQFRGDFLSVIYRKPTSDRQLAQSLQSAWNANGRPDLEIEMFGLPVANISLEDKMYQDFTRSDHYHFWSVSLPAIFITDSANFRGEMVKCYHHECDNVTNLLTDGNIQFLGKIADSMTSTMVTLSGAQGDTSDTVKITAPLYLLLLMSMLNSYFNRCL